MKMRELKKWLFTLFSGRPHFVIGGNEAPYMLRWFLIPRNPLCNIYLHKFLRSDEDRALHDHPWHFLSLILSGSYQEITENFITLRQRFSIGFRHASHRHRVVLLDGANNSPLSVWTLVITGPRIRDWGFWCPRGFVGWKEFTATSDRGSVGKGCDQ